MALCHSWRKLVELHPGEGLAAPEPLAPLVLLSEECRFLAGALQLRLGLAVGGTVGTDLVPDGVELGLGLLPLQPEQHRVHLEEGLTPFDLLVVADEHLRDHSVHRRGDEDVLRLDVGVLGRDDTAGGRIPEAAHGEDHERSEGEEEHAAEPSHPVPQAAHPAAAEPPFARGLVRGLRAGHQSAPAATRRGGAPSSRISAASASASGRSVRFARMVSR